MTHEIKKIAAQASRVCLARQIKQGDKEAAKQRLYSGLGQGRFGLVASGDWPAGETWFDVAFDSDTLYVSVMTLEAANSGLVMDGFTRDNDVVEVFFDPFCDRLGFNQYIAGTEGTRMETSHWPYRDPASHNHRDSAWKVEIEEEIHRPDIARFFFFSFNLETVRGGDCIGLNVGRTQNRISEYSSWSLVSGNGFPDPGCYGRLWFKPPPLRCAAAEVTIRNGKLEQIELSDLVSGHNDLRVSAHLLDPTGATVAAWPSRPLETPLCFKPDNVLTLTESGRYRLVLTAEVGGKSVQVEPDEFFFDVSGTKKQPFQFQGTYDWPDNFGNVVYSAQDLEREMQWYKDCGLDRIYWLDYTPAAWRTRSTRVRKEWAEKIAKSEALFGGDFLNGAVRAAHQAGQEFITIFKPWDLRPEEPFIQAHPDYQIRRNPAWTPKQPAPIAEIRLYQSDESPFPFAPADLKLWQSTDNKKYTPVPDGSMEESIVDRPESVWSPVGPIAGKQSRRVRCLTLRGVNISEKHLALTAASDPAQEWRNREYRMVELVDAAGNVIPSYLDIRAELPNDGFDFGPRKLNSPSWSRADVEPDQLAVIRGNQMALGLTTRQDLFLPGFLEPAFPEVRTFLLDSLRRGIDAGADGISLRIAHHAGCIDWLSYGYAEPVLEAFRQRTGRDPQPCNEDYTLIRLIRGECYTQFLRDASAMAHEAGVKFLHHLENRMLTSPDVDCYCQIHWDWRTWIQEGLLDEIDLKYIGPDHPDCYRDILPLARRHGVKVNWICAEPEPRSKPRSINESPLFMQRAIDAGLNGINLYELWLYRRMTDNGHPMTRGSGEAIIRNMRQRLEKLTETPSTQ